MDKYVNINFSCFAGEMKWATAYLIKFKIVVVLNMAINILAILLYSMSGVISFENEILDDPIKLNPNKSEMI